MKKLEVIKSVGEVYAGVTRHYLELLATAWVWLLAGAAVILLAGDLVLSDVATRLEQMARQAAPEGANVSAGEIFQMLIFMGIYWLTAVAAAVRWHRFVLLGEHSVRSGLGEPGFFLYVIRYVWAGIKLFVVYIIAVLVFVLIYALTNGTAGSPAFVSVVGSMLSLAMLIWGAVLLLRMSLALPEAATGGQGSLRAALAATENNIWQLLGYALLITLGLIAMNFIYSYVLLFLLSMLAGTSMAELGGMKGLSPELRVVSFVLQLPLQFFNMMVGVTMLSVAYREIIGLPTDRT